jgi:hypothetical protein
VCRCTSAAFVVVVESRTLKSRLDSLVGFAWCARRFESFTCEVLLVCVPLKVCLRQLGM